MRTRHMLAVTLFGLAAAVGAPARADITVHTNTIIRFCSPALCPPDLAVREEVRNGRQGFAVYNVGQFNAGAFRISVLRGAGSYAIDVPSLLTGASLWYETDLACSEPITIIVNPFNALPESNYNNNSVGYYGWCGL